MKWWSYATWRASLIKKSADIANIPAGTVMSRLSRASRTAQAVGLQSTSEGEARRMDCEKHANLNCRISRSRAGPWRNTMRSEDASSCCAVCSQSYNRPPSPRNEGLRTSSVYFKALAGLRKRIQRAVRQAAKAEIGPSMAVLVVG